MFFSSSQMRPDAPDHGVLQLTPLRVELWAGQDMMQGRPATVWKA